MPGLNFRVDELEALTLSTDSPQQSDMIRDVLTGAVELELTATVDISGGTTSGTVRTETPHAILEYVACDRNNDEFVRRIPGPFLAMLTRLVEARPVRYTTLVDANVQTGTAISATYLIPFGSQLQINPFESVYYPPPGTRELRVWAKRAASPSGELVSGGDRTVTVSNIKVRVWQHFAPGPADYRPDYLIRYEMADSRAISATVPNFRVDVETEELRRVWMLLIASYRDGRGVANILNTVTFESDRVKVIDAVPYATLRTWDDRFFPGIDPAAGTTQTGTYQGRPDGYLAFPFVAPQRSSRWGLGKSRMALDARKGAGYRLTLDVTSGAGAQLIRQLYCLYESVPGWTLQ